MFDVLITIATGLFFTRYWSKWRYGYFDFFCGGAAIVGAFLLPALAEKFVPEFFRPRRDGVRRRRGPAGLPAL